MKKITKIIFFFGFLFFIGFGAIVLSPHSAYAGNMLGSSTNYNISASPNQLLLADIDGDGDDDIATSNPSSNSASILLGKGDGTFIFVNSITSVVISESIALEDFNRDGNIDVALANKSANSVRIYLGNGDGTVQLGVNYAVGNNPRFVTTGYFNGDSYVDIVTSNFDDNTVSILLGVGDGTFGAKTDYSVGSKPIGVSVADLDADGSDDIAVANTNDYRISVLINNGNAIFASTVYYGVGSGPRYIDAGDLDGDGNLDLGVTNVNSDSISILHNNGNGVFATHIVYETGNQPMGISLTDINNNGTIDALVTNKNSHSISIFLGNGNGTLNTKDDYTVGAGPVWLVTKDVDGDGFQDVITANSDGESVSVLINQLKNTRIFTAPGPGGEPRIKGFAVDGTADNAMNFMSYESAFRGGVYVASGDIDADGEDEVVTGPGVGGGPHLRVFEKDGIQRGIQFFPFHPEFHGGLSVATGDVDGDGKDEIAVAQATLGQAWVKVYRYNSNKEILAEFNAFGSPEVGANIAMGDIDLDGKDELIVGAGPGGGPHIRVYDIGTSPVTGPNQGAVLKGIQFFAFHPDNRSGISLAAGDTDGDKKAEIAVSQLEGDEAWTKVYRFNTSKTVLGEWRAYGQGVYTGARVSMGDVDFDGFAEVVTGPGQGGGPHIRGFEANGTPVKNLSFFSYDTTFRGGARSAIINY